MRNLARKLARLGRTQKTEGMHALLLAALLSASPAKAGHQARIGQPQKRSSAPPARRPSYPTVQLVNVNLHESIRWRPVDDKGRPRKAADKELTRLLRCRHTGKQRRVDPRLGRVIYALARHYGKPVEIYSGYRPRQYCTRKHSRHLTASAIDFRIPGVKNEDVIAWLRQSFHPVGVGYYPNGVHVHLDVDRTVDTYWVDAGDPPPAGDPLLALADSAATAAADDTAAAAAEDALADIAPTTVLDALPRLPAEPAAPAFAGPELPPLDDPAFPDAE